ncbi:MAG: YqjF family protein [Planctomycetota bacterium]|jgi:uncharacterized protein YqjF (DUF2071 family)
MTVRVEMSDAGAARPRGRPGIRFRWLHLLFAHWPVPADVLRPMVPDALDIDTHGGNAWVGLVPFTMRDVRHTWMPPIPTMHHFHECNVRTYVSREGEAGVWFFSLDAASRLAVWGARRRWNLNYLHARMSLVREGDTIRYAVQRAGEPEVSMRCTWTAGEARPRSTPGSLVHFLTERYQLYVVDRRGRPWRGRIWHEPWRLREATLESLEDDLVAAAGIDVSGAGPPHLLHADEIATQAWGLERA